MITTLDHLRDDHRFDVIVIGSGVAGMSAALFAAIEGASVLLVEATSLLGGTSAISAGSVWIPNTRHARAVASDDTPDQARRFLDSVVGNHASASLREAFLQSGPDAVATLEDSSDVRFRPYATHPDYEQDHEGATLRGRAMEPVPFDGRVLGTALDALRPPIPEFTVFGGMMVDRTDINHLLNLARSRASFAHAARILGRYVADRLSGRRRGTRLVMGNALTGRLLASLQQRGVPILLDTVTTAITTGVDGVNKVSLRSGSITRTIAVGRALVLAAGGFGRHPTRRAELLHAPTPGHSPAAPGATGAIQDLALGLGARLGSGNADNAFWAPVSVRQRADGSTAVFPHFVLDRSKPGTVCVDQSGRRFTCEADSYHRFARAMFEVNKVSPCIPCFIIADSVALGRYGLGMVRMKTRDLRPFLADGYLVEGASIAELAVRLGIPADNLARTVALMNDYARSGIDPEFGRGSTAYHRNNGDPAHGPNPALGPIATPPFYAVRLFPGEIGSATGLVTDGWARVLKADDTPIGRLYACGNEANSVMGGVYPGPGITLGPAIVFAYRAMQHALERQSGMETPG